MKQLLHALFAGETLSVSEARNSLLAIGKDSVSDAQIVAFMSVFQIRGIRLEELAGFRDALLELSLPVTLEAGPTIDVCGTGGDGKNTFNISTCTAFVLADMGYHVVKHGNYGVSSMCGSSTVLEALGYRFTTDRESLQRQLDTHRICFLHAPLFHPALQRVAPLRKALGVPTFFNSIGPLVNPAQPVYQLSGTHSLELAKKYTHLLRNHRERFHVLHGLNGYDELTFTGDTRIFGTHTDRIISATPAGRVFREHALSGGQTIADAARIVRNVLSGKGTIAQHQSVAGNTALALQLFHPEWTFDEAFEQAYAHILSGTAIRLLPSI